MNDSSLHPLARDYLKRLKKAARRLPRARRKELIEEIKAHLSEALPAGASEAEALNVLERLGEPAEIVAEAGTGQAPATRAGLHEWLAIPLLLIGGFIVIVGWLVGVVLLWTSRVWTLRDKLIGTLVVPGGLTTLVLLTMFATPFSGSSSTESVTCTPTKNGEICGGNTISFSGPSTLWAWAASLALLVLPIFTSAYLAWRANRLETVVS